MKNLKCNLPIWLLVLLVSFGFFACQDGLDEQDGEPNAITLLYPRNEGGMVFTIVDVEYNNLFADKENAPYDMDYIHIITPDGKYRDDLGEQYMEHYHIPYYEGFTFVSPLLEQIAGRKTYEEKHWKRQYANKPLYLIISPNDTDTIMWKTPEEKLYHNGKVTNRNAIIKDLKN